MPTDAALAFEAGRRWLSDELDNLPHPAETDLAGIAAGLTDQPVPAAVIRDAQRRVACLTAELKQHLRDLPAPDDHDHERETNHEGATP